ncbi:MAG: thiol-disulfide oxidoreductase DCC family protein [Bacteroidia bacterium]
MNNDARIILFDGVCNLCNSSVQFVIKHDKEAKFKFASLQSKSGQALLKKFNLPLDQFNSFIYVRGDKAIQRSAGALNVLRDLGGFWKLLYGFIIVPPFIRNFVYDYIAKNRYRFFGTRESCMIPTPDLKRRFLD